MLKIFFAILQFLFFSHGIIQQKVFFKAIDRIHFFLQISVSSFYKIDVPVISRLQNLSLTFLFFN